MLIEGIGTVVAAELEGLSLLNRIDKQAGDRRVTPQGPGGDRVVYGRRHHTAVTEGALSITRVSIWPSGWGRLIRAAWSEVPVG